MPRESFVSPAPDLPMQPNAYGGATAVGFGQTAGPTALPGFILRCAAATGIRVCYFIASCPFDTELHVGVNGAPIAGTNQQIGQWLDMGKAGAPSSHCRTKGFTAIEGTSLTTRIFLAGGQPQQITMPIDLRNGDDFVVAPASSVGPLWVAFYFNEP